MKTDENTSIPLYKQSNLTVVKKICFCHNNSREYNSHLFNIDNIAQKIEHPTSLNIKIVNDSI